MLKEFKKRISRIRFKTHQIFMNSRSFAKVGINSLLINFGLKPLYNITTMDRMRTVGELGIPNRQFSALRKFWRWAFNDTFLGWSFALLVVCVVLFMLFGGNVGWDDVSVEWWGLIFDIGVILIGFGLIQQWKIKKEYITRQNEIIEDFRKWDSEEAAYRVLGAIRRLNNLNVTQFNFKGGTLRNVNLENNGISSIVGSQLSGSDWLSGKAGVSVFEGVNFSNVDCRNVQFHKDAMLESGFVVHRAVFKNCNFFNADLRGSVFDGASLIWDELPEENLYEEVGSNPDGSPIWDRAITNRFNDADLVDVSFQLCEFRNADFREAVNIQAADFSGATGLDTCVFDDEETKRTVLNSSQAGQ